jgi:hypothetical protein
MNQPDKVSCGLLLRKQAKPDVLAFAGSQVFLFLGFG